MPAPKKKKVGSNENQHANYNSDGKENGYCSFMFRNCCVEFNSVIKTHQVYTNFMVEIAQMGFIFHCLKIFYG